MPLHLIKLSVGATCVADLEGYIAERLRALEAARKAPEHIHTTRMFPKRRDEILGGGSLFWVIRGYVAARQRLLDLRAITDADGIGRCQLVLDPTVVPVVPRPHRPFQGWRYLADDARPGDLDQQSGAAEMPEHLRNALRELGLL